MKPFHYTAASALLILCTACAAFHGIPAYPKTRTVDTVDTFHGEKVPDPYRWLEDLDGEDVIDWITAQNEVTRSFLEGIPEREKIKKRLTELWNYEKFSIPVKKGGRYFFGRNPGLQNQVSLYVADSLEEEPRLLLDPNLLSKDGTVALADLSISHDGKLVAYGLSEGGSDWVEYRIRDVASGKDLSDHLKWIKFFPLSWTRDGRGIFYIRFQVPEGDKLQDINEIMQLYFHRLGTPQEEDRLIFDSPGEKSRLFYGSVTEDGRYLVITLSPRNERKHRIYYKDLEKDEGIQKLIDVFEAEFSLIGSDGPLFWFRTDLEAPMGRVIAIDLCAPDRRHWKEVIPEGRDMLEGVTMVSDAFIANYSRDAQSRIKIFDRSGTFVRNLELPGIGSAWGFNGERADREAFYMFTNFYTPPVIFRYDVQSGQSTVFQRPKNSFDPGQFETRQVFYQSRDGVRVPMFISHKKGIPLDGNNPVYLYAYGGGRISFTPWYSPANLAWMEMGGIFALANIRGGGEYGNEWHEAGRLKCKQNCFDDFIAAAEWLIDNRYTSRDKLAIGGGSNGGLLVGACMTQRPDLFGACLPDRGVMDMLRFPEFTIGWAWISEYGDPKDPEMFEVLRAYSPLHNIEPGTAYPATLLTTSDHDDRVVPSHSYKFAAALQAAQNGEEPVLIRIDRRTGHGAGIPTAKLIEEVADQWAFLVRTLDI